MQSPVLKNNIALALVGLALSAACHMAYAADYYVVVPMPGKVAGAAPTEPTENISVTLNAVTLPAGMVNTAYDFNLNAALQVTGDSAFDAGQVGWSVVSGALPQGISLEADGRLAGTPPSQTAPEGASFEVKAAYKGKSAQRTYSIAVGAPASCLTLLQAEPGTPSGTYVLDVDGEGPVPAQQYYCDMVSAGGGWTRVVRQTEAEPVANWNGGVNGASYALANAYIPAHTQVGFGKDEEATHAGYVNFVYTSGSIPRTLVANPATGATYHVHRTSGHYTNHDPELTAGSGFEWSETLSLDITGRTGADWAFAPNYGGAAGRGFSMLGIRHSTAESYAWTVWVR